MAARSRNFRCAAGFKCTNWFVFIESGISLSRYKRGCLDQVRMVLCWRVDEMANQKRWQPAIRPLRIDPRAAATISCFLRAWPLPRHEGAVLLGWEEQRRQFYATASCCSIRSDATLHGRTRSRSPEASFDARSGDIEPMLANPFMSVRRLTGVRPFAKQFESLNAPSHVGWHKRWRQRVCRDADRLL